MHTRHTLSPSHTHEQTFTNFRDERAQAHFSFVVCVRVCFHTAIHLIDIRKVSECVNSGSFQVAGIHKNEYFICSFVFLWANVNFNWQVLQINVKSKFYTFCKTHKAHCMRAVVIFHSFRSTYQHCPNETASDPKQKQIEWISRFRLSIQFNPKQSIYDMHVRCSVAPHLYGANNGIKVRTKMKIQKEGEKHIVNANKQTNTLKRKRIQGRCIRISFRTIKWTKSNIRIDSTMCACGLGYSCELNWMEWTGQRKIIIPNMRRE